MSIVGFIVVVAVVGVVLWLVNSYVMPPFSAFLFALSFAWHSRERFLAQIRQSRRPVLRALGTRFPPDRGCPWGQ
jgi:Flp pilus assembly protein TadB